MSFPPRSFYCRSIIRWPIGLVIFRGSSRLRVAHRSCCAKYGPRSQRVAPMPSGDQILTLKELSSSFALTQARFTD